VGIGETGLDYHYDRSPRDIQKAAYERFIALARVVRRPVISHVRDAHEDAVEILRVAGAAEVGGVIHCFTGGVAEARRYLDLGHHLSFSGILTFKNAQPIREAAAFAPLERLLIETDAPYLAPIPHRGKRNEPAYIVETLRVLAEVRDVAVGEVEAATVENTRRLFGLPA
jgi:TatD DNase family protein